MSDSLRDQLIAAGFEAPKKPVSKPAGKGRHKKRQASSKNKNNKELRSAKTTQQDKNAEAEAAILERKKLKAKIKDLIDANKIENWKGEVAYRYTVDKRIRELYVNEATQKLLTDREVAITRLNGDTYLVPRATATEIAGINPQWSVFNTSEDEQSSKTDNDDYAEFQVPDDLQW